MSNSGPKKSLGQHWLRDKQFLSHICEVADLSNDDVVLEIGPGLGTLTLELSKQAKKVIAVEFDESLIKNLQNTMPSNVEVIHHDILDFDLSNLPSGYKVVANIPYYLTSHLVRLLLTSQHKPSLVVLLVQKEVAERIVAKPGKMSTLSVASQFYADVELGEVVPAEHFEPPPKVDSQVVILKTKTDIPKLDEKRFFRIVKAGFGERRKKLANSLSGGLHLPKEQIIEVLKEADLNEMARAQELSIADWTKLHKLFDGTMKVQN